MRLRIWTSKTTEVDILKIVESICALASVGTNAECNFPAEKVTRRSLSGDDSFSGSPSYRIRAYDVVLSENLFSVY